MGGNALVVVGSGFPYYDLAVDLWEEGSWTALGNFTLTSGDWNYIASYSTVTVEETMYLIGGYLHEEKVFLGRRSGSGISWSRGTDLLIPRDGHRSAVIGQYIFNVGGRGTLETESWEVADDHKRYRHQPELENYGWFPEIF